MQALTIGKHTVPYPLIQGGMGVRVSGYRLAGHVARCGGIGIIATAGLALNSPHYTGAKIIISGAGLPLGLPGLTAEWPDVALVPIASSVKAAELIARKWKKSFDRLPDAVVVEDPLTAGGHLGASVEEIEAGTYDQYATVRGVKAYFLREWKLNIPVIAAGGIWDRGDLLYALEQGADAVQMASRFVVTEECDAEPAFKQAYLDCRQEDIGLIMSPAGLPGRAIRGNIDHVRNYDLEKGTRCPAGCLKRCTYKADKERFCIVQALDRAQRGEVDTGLVFCGSNAWKADRITTVREIFDELFAESIHAADVG
jgi:NAD(P)H-dependent flavin oxidoreductase YrpB (nitropropane dioxygenase family)